MSNIPNFPKSKDDIVVRRTAVKDWLTYDTMSPLGRSLMDIAKQIEESDAPPMDEESIEAELLKRRGGYSQNGE